MSNVEELCQVWANNHEDVIVMSSRFFQLGLGDYKFITENLPYKNTAWSMKDMDIYRAGRVVMKDAIMLHLGSVSYKSFIFIEVQH